MRLIDLSVVVLECLSCHELFSIRMDESPPKHPMCPDCELELDDGIVAHRSGVFERVR